MVDAFKSLVESGLMTEETQSVIETAFATKIQETRDQVTAELREEFAEKFSHDKGAMVEAIDRMLSDRLVVELSDLASDKQALAEAKVNYQRKMEGDAKVLESFVLNQMGKELSEFQSDRRKIAENFEKLEQFIVHALAGEIKEFSKDKRDLAEAKVKLVREAKDQFKTIKTQFIERTAKIVESVVTSKLTSEVAQLREDIDSARQVNFGRKLFEAFAQEYSASHLNEKSETAKLLKTIAKKDQELSESKNALQKKQTLVESKEREIRIAKDMATRQTVVNELLGTLAAPKRELMRDLLESVQTSKLASAFDKYLPSVVEGQKKVATKSTITESTAVTGNRESNSQEVGYDNILDIRKLAGLK